MDVRSACIGATALLLLAGAAQAQPTDIDEHGRPSRLPLQANWWAAQAAADPKGGGEKPAGHPAIAAAKPAGRTERKGGEPRASCETAPVRAAEPSKDSSPPCPAAK
jgi:hypothetical protein